MRIALIDGERRLAAKGLKGACPLCNSEVIAKCGEIVTHHWAHRSFDVCDTWAEPMTDWHTRWQARFAIEYREVIVGNHIADVKLRNGRVIEFQHSGISPAEIRDREDFYGDMVWVFDATDAYDNERLWVRYRDDLGYGYRRFTWIAPRISIAACQRPVFLDLDGEKLLYLNNSDDRYENASIPTSLADFDAYVYRGKRPPGTQSAYAATRYTRPKRKPVPPPWEAPDQYGYACASEWFLDKFCHEAAQFRCECGVILMTGESERAGVCAHCRHSPTLTEVTR